MITSPATLPSVDALCQSVMRGVVAAGAVTADSDLDRAVEIMRAEVKALLFGDEYADERDCIMRRSVSDATVLRSVVAACVVKIAG